HDLEILEAGAVVELHKSKGFHVTDGAGPTHDGDRLAGELLAVGKDGGDGDAIHTTSLNSQMIYPNTRICVKGVDDTTPGFSVVPSGARKTAIDNSRRAAIIPFSEDFARA